MEPATKENSMATVAMVKEVRCMQTEITTKVTGSKVKDMDMVYSDVVMELRMK